MTARWKSEFAAWAKGEGKRGKIRVGDNHQPMVIDDGTTAHGGRVPHSRKAPSMPVEFLHLLIAAAFLVMWALISRIAFGHDAPPEKDAFTASPTRNAKREASLGLSPFAPRK
jgi:hypothetical protein